MRRFLWIIVVIFLAQPLLSQDSPTNTPQGMVLIPGGTFTMGIADGQAVAPPKRISVSPFYMDIYEVSNGQYLKFCEATGHKLPEFWGMEEFKSGPGFLDYPVIGVSQSDAMKYAKWAGKRLPTEAEWEFAAMGGTAGQDYPYGHEADRKLARFNDPTAEKGPVEIGSYEANGYGLFDMSGNVWEWVSDWFDENQMFKSFRGGGWHSGPGCCTVHRRNALPQYWVDIAGGFRCVKEVEN
jgi:formylglycine-generating enzyme required for sulfatase activity